MIGHYLHTAWLNLRRSPWLSALIVLAIAVGIGSSMTVYAVYRVMSLDPIPRKSGQLYAPRLDTLGPEDRGPGLRPGPGPGEPDFHMAYRDAVALRDAHLGRRQAAMYATNYVVNAEGDDTQPTAMLARATDADFFDMFQVPFHDGGKPWSHDDDRNGASVVVLSEERAMQLFKTTRVVGRTIRIDAHPFRIVGVTRHWRPQPRFYDIGFNDGWAFAGWDGLFLPLNVAVAMMDGHPLAPTACPSARQHGPPLPRNREEWLASECLWTQLWVELPTAVEVKRFEEYLRNYAASQQRSGRFDWLPATRLRNVRDTLVAYRVIPDEYRIATLLAFSFLVICLINAIGLMLARFRGRVAELELRRALGASQRSLFAQCLAESALLGVLGGIGGLALLSLGLWVQGRMAASLELETRDYSIMLLAVGMAVGGAIAAGLYPAWRASRTRSVAGTAVYRRGGVGMAWIIVQVAVTLALVDNALFVAWQKLDVIRRATGMDDQALIVITSRWPRERADLPERVARDLQMLRALPGVRAVTVATSPLTTSDIPVSASAGKQALKVGAAHHRVDDHTLSTWGTTLVDGQWFGPQDIRPLHLGELPPTVAINRRLAETLYPGVSAVGRTLHYPAANDATATIVAVVEGIPGSRRTGSPYSLFVPGTSVGRAATYMVRTTPGMLDAVIREAWQRLRSLDPERAFGSINGPPVEGIAPFSLQRSVVDSPTWALIIMLGTTCVLLLGVNALGIFGLASCWTAQQRVQIGIRRALGARRGHILLRFQLENLFAVGVGVVLGSALALAGNRWLMPKYQVPPIPFAAVLGGALLVVLLCQCAVFWPALRASLIPPAVATRTE